MKRKTQKAVDYDSTALPTELTRRLGKILTSTVFHKVQSGVSNDNYSCVAEGVKKRFLDVIGSTVWFNVVIHA